jgi:REP element-mobilizing transposase RayT
MARMNRADLFDPLVMSVFHCIQRCVRRCFLCGCDAATGRSFDHRKRWLEERLELLAGVFGIDVLAFAILSNHFHVVLRNRPDVVEQWSDAEVAARWLRLFPVRPPARKTADALPEAPSLPELNAIVNNPERLKEIRRRLSDISWFMRSIAEPIARRANREDEVTGRFWEGRFKATKLCDETAILACCAYVDLNAIRAGLAETPETSDFTSAKRRIDARQADSENEEAAAEVESSPSCSSDTRPNPDAKPRSPAKIAKPPDAWLSPIDLREASAAPGPQMADSSNSRCSDKGFLPASLDDYLELLDWTGRQIAPGKRGVIPADAPPILRRLRVETADWLTLATGFGHLFSRIAGSKTSASRERHLRSDRRFRRRNAELLGG